MSREAILESAAQVIPPKRVFMLPRWLILPRQFNSKKASLYHHFSSKQDILLELLDRALDIVTRRMVLVMKQELPADEKLRLAMRAYLNTLSEQGDLVSVLLLEHRSLDVEYQLTTYRPARQVLKKCGGILIQEGVDTGVFSVKKYSADRAWFDGRDELDDHLVIRRLAVYP